MVTQQALVPIVHLLCRDISSTSILIAFVIVLVSMIFHELAHGLVAYWLGDDTAKSEGRLTLNPTKHLDPFLSILLPLMMFISGGPVFGGAKPVPVNSLNLKHGVWGMALVAIAGPLTNFVLALVGFLIGYYSGAFMTGVGIWGEILADVVTINLGFGVFNLIPIPPLDGSRVLYAIAPDGVRNVMAQMERWGILVVMFLVVLAPGVISAIMGGAINGILEVFYWIVGVR